MESSTRAATGTSRRIVVSSNCQTGGIAAALQAFFPDDQVVPVPMPAIDEHGSHLAEQLRDADAWVSIGRFSLVERYQLTSIHLVRIPKLIFTAFHPDLVYARRPSTGTLVTPHYNSAIVVWAYRNNVAARDAAALFNETTFHELGYLDRWNDSTRALEVLFRESDLDFRSFYLAMRRQGVFMHTPNHPKAIALASVATLVAQKLGADADVLNQTIDINDALNHVIWPIYPGIGESLALPSSYAWKLEGGKVIRGPLAYVESSYHTYRTLGIAPDDLEAVAVKTAPPIDDILFNRVLGSHLRGAA